MLWPWLQARLSGWQLAQLSGAAAATHDHGVVAVVPFYGSHDLLTAFLAHHRGIGVDQFVFLDLSGKGNLAAGLAEHKDCAVWRPRGRTDPERAIHWLNYLRWRYATGRWCLSLEPSELFVFRNCEWRRIKDLIEFLHAENRNHLFGLVVEMYGDGPALEAGLKPGENPLDKLPYFDAYGYDTLGPGRWRNVVVRGGVLRRTVFQDTPFRSPPLNRVPLVKWRWYYGYLAGTRLMMPRRLNVPHSRWHTSPTACLLRFALLDGDAALAVAARAEATQIVADRSLGAYSALAALRRRPLKQELSLRFTGTASLVSCGLLNPGQWF